MPSQDVQLTNLIWQGDKEVPVGLTKEGVSAAVFNDKLYIFYQGTKHGRIWYNTISSDGVWRSDDLQITDCRCSSSPSAVVYDNRLYVFYQGAGDNGDMYYNTLDVDFGWLGEHKIADCRLSCSPCAVVFNNQIYLFHQGSGDSPHLWYNTTEKIVTNQ